MNLSRANREKGRMLIIRPFSAEARSLSPRTSHLVKAQKKARNLFLPASRTLSGRPGFQFEMSHVSFLRHLHELRPVR